MITYLREVTCYDLLKFSVFLGDSTVHLPTDHPDSILVALDQLMKEVTYLPVGYLVYVPLFPYYELLLW